MGDRIRTILVIPLAIVFSLTTFDRAAGQSQEKIYSVMMLNFAKGIQWPGSPSGNFVIGVLSYPPLADELNQSFSTTRIGNRKIEILEFSSPDEISKCHMIFVPAFKAKLFTNILTKLDNAATLIVSNKTDLARKGAGVNFVFVEGKLKYEINCKTIEKRGMKISANVKGMGILIE